jgi:poly-gamma-glutamate synthesis protein (capsule biosynthesis protein)
MMDYRGEGLISTLEALAHNGVGMVGAGRSESEARCPFVTSRGGWRLGLLAYSDVNPPGYWATGDHPGISSSMDAFRAKMEQEITSVRPQVDFLVISIHWGEEYRHEPNNRQRELARFLVDQGADVVIGHHPHVLQRTEVYRGKLILYSLGNFISYSARGPGRLSVVALIPTDDPKKTRFVPVTIVEGQPRLASDREVSDTILDYLRPVGRR